MSNPLARLFVAYVRVSTDRQASSGLGLDAQRETVASYLAQHSGQLLQPVFVETESGRMNERPELAKALARCRATGATLLIAKVDRLARNTRFLLGVVEGSGEGGVVFCDLPTIPAGPVGKFIITQMAAVAELEGGLIAQRTRAALGEAKKRRATAEPPLPPLGGLRNGQRAPTLDEARSGAQASVVKRQMKALTHAHQLAPTITAALAQGTSLQGIARQLQTEGVPSPRDGDWTATAVRRIVAKLGLRPASTDAPGSP